MVGGRAWLGLRLSPLTCSKTSGKYISHIQQKPEGAGDRQTEVSITQANETEAQREREREEDDLASQRETAPILRGVLTPTAAPKPSSIHADTLVF